jgi:hypothetical protein
VGAHWQEGGTGDARILPCKLVLKIKRHEDGTVERYKARVVILGNLQQVGVDMI